MAEISLIILAIVAVYFGVIALIYFLFAILTAPISNDAVRRSIKIMVVIVSPFWLYIDWAIGLPLLQLACSDSGVVIEEPFNSDKILINEGYYGHLPTHAGSLNDDEFTNLEMFFSAPWSLGAILSSNGLKVVKNFDDEHALFWIAPLGDPHCLNTPAQRKIYSTLLKTSCIARQVEKGTYDGYLLNLEPVGNVGHETLRWGLTKYFATLEHQDRVVALSTTYEFQEYLKIPTLAPSGRKAFYCGNQEREWSFIEDFVETIVKRD